MASLHHNPVPSAPRPPSAPPPPAEPCRVLRRATAAALALLLLAWVGQFVTSIFVYADEQVLHGRLGFYAPNALREHDFWVSFLNATFRNLVPALLVLAVLFLLAARLIPRSPD